MSQQVLIMGVSGCGKTTVGKMLADEWGAVFYDADDFHPAANRDKMSRGIPLDDADRQPWLKAIAETIREPRHPFVLACSALRESYRQQLLAACPELKIIHLHGSRELLWERMRQRQGHFMPASLLDSQLATLEPPADALHLDIAPSPKELTALICKHLSACQKPGSDLDYLRCH
jgi:gluconokinase